MDLIYVDKNGLDVGVVLNYNLDNESSVEGKNCSFVLDMPIDEDILNNCKYLYMNDTEYGGIVDEQTIDTAKKTMKLTGRTWRGILFNKIIEPDQGSDWHSVSGDVNEVLSQLITKIDLDDRFFADDEPLGVEVEYQFEQFTDAYTGIINMLSTIDYKLMIRWQDGKAKLYAEPIAEYSQENAITSDLFDFQITIAKNSVNHMIGYGLNPNEERETVHKYIQSDGTIGNVQHFFADDEYVAVYDKGNVKTIDELEEATVEELEKATQQNQVKINSYDLNCDIGDKFTAQDLYTGLVVEQIVTNKIVVIDDNTIKTSYKVGAL